MEVERAVSDRMFVSGRHRLHSSDIYKTMGPACVDYGGLSVLLSVWHDVDG